MPYVQKLKAAAIPSYHRDLEKAVEYLEGLLEQRKSPASPVPNLQPAPQRQCPLSSKATRTASTCQNAAQTAD